MNDSVKNFKPDDVTIELGDKKLRLIYDLNSFCELEKIYDSIDDVIKMLLGAEDDFDLSNVTYCDAPALASDIKVGGLPLEEILKKVPSNTKPRSVDTLNLLWAGCLHDNAIYNEFGEITGYSIKKDELGALVNFTNIGKVTSGILVAILRDLMPATPDNDTDEKNAEVPEKKDKITLIK